MKISHGRGEIDLGQLTAARYHFHFYKAYLRQLWLRRQADAPRLTGAFEETPLIRHPGGSLRDRMRPKRLFSECNKECEGFQCNPCGLVFANADALSTHLDFHTRSELLYLRQCVGVLHIFNRALINKEKQDDRIRAGVSSLTQ
ncbi:unnamed protein product [Nezara viridula]|uniref:C2H2-type domain-containing protein n=1 Tax=Nezara viridula TaxID=85310 RepID=A0A9P0ML52_NEZVI|nr:unnamed protein product [Nezara viridula]